MHVSGPSLARWRGLLAGVTALALLMAPSVSRAGELLPDIMATQPTDISLEVTEDGRHLLRFTQGFANLGPGVLRVQGVPTAEEGVMQGYQEILDEAGQVTRRLPIPSIIFHPHHHHWHAGDVASYELRRSTPWGELVAQNGKISYCLVDHSPLPGYTGRYRPPVFLNCKAADQGMTPGWVDIYESHLHDQWIDVTEVPDGVYYLVIKGDPHHLYTEIDHGDWTNNMAWARVELSDGGHKVRVMAENEILISLAGERLHFPVHPRTEDGRAIAHIRLAERLGATVLWDGTRAIITRGAQRLEVTPGQRFARVNGTMADMGTEPIFEENRLLVPVRFLCEQLGFKVHYDPETATAEIE